MSELPPDLVRTLLTVVDAGTFDAAAALLHVTPSAVSQRVKALEQRAGRVLVTRSKPVRATASGEVVVRHARQVAALDHALRMELGLAEAGAARLSIAVNADSLATWFLPALVEVPREPLIRFELHREDEAHTAALLREGRVMAAVTSAAEAVAGCTVRGLGRARYLPVSTPDFAARYLVGGSLVERLEDAPVVAFDQRDLLQDEFVRSLGGSGASSARHLVPSSEGFRDSVAAGLGWGLVPEAHAVGLSGVEVVVPGAYVDVPLYWQQWKLDVPALSVVAAVVGVAAAAALYQ
ncbi:LysR family transcriptional regulator ArgP [Actinokineospora guangxiensis]|uniref:LysR family transcriptional regulator ArgP n=1 Tax=Actinokineospora guangxiensis TaxID=1490288 RepID=A0ABW0EZ89_9PSEU